MRPPYPTDSSPYSFDGLGPERSWFERIGLPGLGLGVTLISLAMLFAAGLIAFGHKRFEGMPAVVLPPLLWASTVVLAVSAVTMVKAQRAARLGQAPAMKRWLLITSCLAIAFIATQTPALWQLLTAHQSHATGLHGSVFFLILVHALHVLGGLVPLGYLTYRAHRPSLRRGLPSPQGVTLTGIYWHFLEVVWIVLLVTFLA
jgi:heme/copper-type cytochrome/quinol oxidase subunit 3